MEIYLLFIVYFIVGIIQDFFFTLNLRYVAREKIMPAIFTSFITVVISMSVLFNIITKLSDERGILAIIIYAAGIGVGTFLAMKFKLGLKY